MATDSHEFPQVAGFVRYLATGRGVESPKPARLSVLPAATEPHIVTDRWSLPVSDGVEDPEPGSFRVPPAA